MCTKSCSHSGFCQGHARGSHIRVACRSVCDQDQESWLVKNRPWWLDCSVLRLSIADFMGVQRTRWGESVDNNDSNMVGETNVLDIAISPRLSLQVGARSSQIVIAIVELFRLQGNTTGFWSWQSLSSCKKGDKSKQFCLASTKKRATYGFTVSSILVHPFTSQLS